MNLDKKKCIQRRRRLRIRKRILGSLERPRLSLHFSGKHIYAQCIDDTIGKTLVYLSTQSAKLSVNNVTVAGASSFGEIFGNAVVKAGISDVVFDRGIRRYHGKVKAFADSVRNIGVKF